jgi:hypothetical protein
LVTKSNEICELSTVPWFGLNYQRPLGFNRYFKYFNKINPNPRQQSSHIGMITSLIAKNRNLDRRLGTFIVKSVPNSDYFSVSANDKNRDGQLDYIRQQLDYMRQQSSHNGITTSLTAKDTNLNGRLDTFTVKSVPNSDYFSVSANDKNRDGQLDYIRQQSSHNGMTTSLAKQLYSLTPY